jgi:hypothetical protein
MGGTVERLSLHPDADELLWDEAFFLLQSKKMRNSEFGIANKRMLNEKCTRIV